MSGSSGNSRNSRNLSQLAWSKPIGRLGEWQLLGDGSHDYFLSYFQERCLNFVPFPVEPIVGSNGRQRQTPLARVFKFRPDAAGAWFWVTKLKVLNLAKKNTQKDFPRSRYPRQGAYGVVLDSRRHPGLLVKKISFSYPEDDPFKALALIAREIMVFTQQYADYPYPPDFPGYRLFAYALNTPGRPLVMHGRLSLLAVPGMDLVSFYRTSLKCLPFATKTTKKTPEIFAQKSLFYCALALKILGDLFLGLNKLKETNGRVHLDLKEQNAMINPSFNASEPWGPHAPLVRLIDFGGALNRGECLQYERSLFTTYRPPEPYLDDDTQVHGPAVDACSLGVVFAHLFSNFYWENFKNTYMDLNGVNSLIDFYMVLELANLQWASETGRISTEIRRTLWDYSIPKSHIEAIIQVFNSLMNLDPGQRLSWEAYLPVGLYFQSVSEVLRAQSVKFSSASKRDFSALRGIPIPSLLTISARSPVSGGGSAGAGAAAGAGSSDCPPEYLARLPSAAPVSEPVSEPVIAPVAAPVPDLIRTDMRPISPVLLSAVPAQNNVRKSFIRALQTACVGYIEAANQVRWWKPGHSGGKAQVRVLIDSLNTIFPPESSAAALADTDVRCSVENKAQLKSALLDLKAAVEDPRVDKNKLRKDRFSALIFSEADRRTTLCPDFEVLVTWTS